MPWTDKAPRTPGLFWFIGDPFDEKGTSTRQELHLVTVIKASNGYVYIASGAFIYPIKGLWQPATIPDFPPGVAVTIPYLKK